MRNIILFAVVALVAAGLAPRFIDKMSLASTPAPAKATPAVVRVPAPAYSGGPRTVVIRPDDRGHFAVEGIVDGRRIGFMVDTGATKIALTRATPLGSAITRRRTSMSASRRPR